MIEKKAAKKKPAKKKTARTQTLADLSQYYEEARRFARMMTERAAQLGMENSTFMNSSGWPAPGHRMSMRDLAILATRLITEFPQYYPYFAQTEYPFDNRAPDNRFNRNPLLALGIGADGLKTGHTQEAGYGLVGSAKQGDRRIVFVVPGLGRWHALRPAFVVDG